MIIYNHKVNERRSMMENNNVKEGINILKKLSPKNQTYFMTLLRLAEAAEDGARSNMANQQRNPTKQPIQHGKQLQEA